MEENEKKAKSNKGLMIALIALVVILIAVIAFMLIKQQKEANAIPQASGLELDRSQGAYVEKPTVEDDSGIDPAVSVTLPGWTQLTIPADTTKIDSGIDFYNPDRNTGYYYLTFVLSIDEDGDGEYETELYKSGLVEPGNHIQEIEISKPLPAGSYAASVMMQPYRMDEEMTATNNGAVNVELIAQ